MKNLVDLKNKIKVGFIINPVAGMGGSVGLKGTDGKVREALLRGSVPHAGERAKIAMEELLPLKASLEILTYGGKMGGEIAKAMGFDCRLLGEDKEEFSALDTLELCKKLKAENVKLLLFAGGDGTARDVYNGVGTSVIALGIPAGVKIHSPVYAKSPKTAGALAALYLSGKEKETKEEEVLDIDEEKYRNNVLSTTLYGYLTIPYKKNYTQNRKTATPITEKNAIRSIGMKIVSEMEEGTYYLIGAGTTTAGIMEELGLKNTLIGVDLVLNKQLLGN
ncbi:MAG: NAD(+)/NADH kinase, partial [Oscillospiraceae bacterium]